MTAEGRRVSFPLYFGLTVASIGGPLALIALYVPASLDGAAASAGLTTLIASLVFLFPLAIWYRYSERIASDGGLYAFVEAAVGPRLARIQAGFWIISYFLYLVYTVPFIVYYLLPAAVPAASNYQPLLDIVIAVAVAALLLSPLLITLSVMAVIAATQVLIAIVLVAFAFAHLGTPAASLTGHGNFMAIVPGAIRISTLYICASLPLFLAGEVVGGTKAVQRSLIWAFPLVAVLAVIGAIPLSNATGALLDADIPGVTLATAASAHGLGVVVGLGVAISVGGLIIAEFLALTRLLSVLFHRSVRMMLIVSVVVFLVGSLLSLIDPTAAYRILLKPSLIALWVSQLIVVAAYPWFVARNRRIAVADIALAGAASLLMLVALYGAVSSSSGS